MGTNTPELGISQIVAGMNSIIYGSATASLYVLLFLAIGIGAIRKMFLFGNMQALSVANKIIMTAFISGVALMIILPIQSYVKSSLVINSNVINVTTVGNHDYSALSSVFKKMEEFYLSIHYVIIMTITAIATISVSIAAFRIKFSLGNMEVISESKKMIKITIVACVTLLSASFIFQYFIDYFTVKTPNEMLNSIREANEAVRNVENAALSATTASSLLATIHVENDDRSSNQLLRRPKYAGLIEVLTTAQSGNHKLLKKNRKPSIPGAYYSILPDINENYSFKNESSGSTYVYAYRGGNRIFQCSDKLEIYIAVNYGYKCVVSASDGGFTMRVPRLEQDVRLLRIQTTQISALTKWSELKEYVNYFTLKDDEEYIPAPKEIFSKMKFTSNENTTTINQIKETYRNVSDLQAGSGVGYVLSFSFQEDDEPSKVFRKLRFSNLKDMAASSSKQRYYVSYDSNEEIMNLDGLTIEDGAIE